MFKRHFTLLLLVGFGVLTAPKVVALGPLPSPTPVPTEELEAIKLKLKMTIRGRTPAQLYSDMRDGQPSTYVNAGASPLKAESVKGGDIHSLYLVWLDRPGPFDILFPDGTVQSVENPMLHQLVRLSQPAASLEIRSTGAVNHLSELSAYGPGRLPDSVQDWQWLPDGAADLKREEGKVLSFEF